MGCKVNFYDTEAMLGLFQRSGYEIVPFEAGADIYIINTCSVTNLGDKKSRQMIRRAAGRGALVIAAGCYAQVNAGQVSQIEGVNLVIGTKDRGRIVELAEAYNENMGVSSHVTDMSGNTAWDLTDVSRFHSDAGRTRAFLKVEDGCDRYCSYCIIPFARGPVRSRPPSDVLDEARRMAADGYKEIVLTGIHVASYGKDLKNTSLIEIIPLLNGLDGVERIRLSSVEPSFINDRFLDVIRVSPKLCDHFHLSLQSGSDSVLKRMNRRYTCGQYVEAVNMLRSILPDVSLTTDIIVGFPGETEAEFSQTLSLAESVGFSKIHVFPFSPKIGTAAAGMPGQIGEPAKSERVRMLLSLSERLSKAYMNAFIGKTLSVLFERPRASGVYEGYAPNYIKARVSCPKDISNQIRAIYVDNIKDGCVHGMLLQNG